MTVATDDRSRVLTRNHVVAGGRADGRPMLFAHGFGCDQRMWRRVLPAFAGRYRTVAFDHVGAGASDLGSYDPERYGSLRAYADDMVEIARALNLRDAVLVGHSVSATIAVLAHLAAPEIFSTLVLVGISPCYVDVPPYVGGFSREDVEDLLETLDANHLGWSSAMAPVIMGRPDRPDLVDELTDSFCQTDPDIAAHFARVMFLSDHRDALAHVQAPTLVLQCTNDAIAPETVGRYVHATIAGSRYVRLEADGHCPHVSAPAETIRAIEHFLG